MMELVESMFEHAARSVLGAARIEYQGQPIDLAGPYPRVDDPRRPREGLRASTSSPRRI